MSEREFDPLEFARQTEVECPGCGRHNEWTGAETVYMNEANGYPDAWNPIFSWKIVLFCSCGTVFGWEDASA